MLLGCMQVYGKSRTYHAVGVPVIHNIGERSYEVNRSHVDLLSSAVDRGRTKIREWMIRKKVPEKKILAFDQDKFEGKYRLRDIAQIKYSHPADEAVVLDRWREEAKLDDQRYIQQIAAFPTSKEKRVISILVPDAKRYTQGAIRNAELVKTYFPGWTCRFYVTSSVSPSVISTLKSLGSEVFKVPTDLRGEYSGHLWRYTVADDPTVDRFIIRDADFRLNARDRYVDFICVVLQ